FQAEDGIRDPLVTGVQTCALPISITESKKLEFRAVFFNALNHPQFTPGSLSTVQSVARNATRNNLIPGNALFNDSTGVYESNARSEERRVGKEGRSGW